MLPHAKLSGRLIGALRRGGVLVVLTLAFHAAGCSNLGLKESNLTPAPAFETGRQLPRQTSDTEPFAVTNEGKQIEDRLLNRQRAVMLPD